MTHTGESLRASFLEFFESKGHRVVKSAPLLPDSDPTLLFVNAGMVPFKEVFTGREKREYTRATSSQKCVRAGGKHNDLENVGRTARHHTFFEMLGNFSFGDYFKEDACKYAWEFLTDVLGMDKSKLSVTVFGGEDGIPADEDAERIWREVVGVPEAQISRCGAKDNFWAMGDTGPCGPCTEIHYDRGVVEGAFGGDDPEGDRVLEVWNLVFMQYERHADGSMTDLPAPCVDTGMGLERLAMVMNGHASNYDTDLLRPLIAMSESELDKKYTSTDDDDDVAMRVIADHARCTAFLIGDGVLPGNNGREYVLKRIMRRAILFGDRAGYKEPFFHRACEKVVDIFAPAYPELEKARALIQKMVKLEEEAFRRTLDKGLRLFEEQAEGLNPGDVFDGRTAFHLFETHGFPKDLTEVLAAERKLTIDEDGYQAAEELHKNKSKAELGLEGIPPIFRELRTTHGPTRFLGYDTQEASGEIVAILIGAELVDELGAGQRGQVILDETPFYAESGGQVGDTGALRADDAKASVTDTAKIAELHVHTVEVKEGALRKGQKLEGAVDDQRLWDIRRNHSATHLLHRALREILGDHVTQKGSLVAPDKLRFDFAHFEAMKEAEMQSVEDRVNELVLSNVGAETHETSYDHAQELGAMALFGEKYGDEVRVVSFGPSVELCGGIHVERTGDIGLFRITHETALAAGIRRLEAVTGRGAISHVRAQEALLEKAATILQVTPRDLPSRAEGMRAQLKDMERELDQVKAKRATAAAGEAAKNARKVEGIHIVAEKVDLEPKAMRAYADKLRDQLGSGIVALGADVGGKKAALLVALTPDLVGKFHAGKLVAAMAAKVDGKGGGKPDLAQAGGQNPAGLDDALNLIDDLVAAAI
jgi:alanyl-tRNA synthetase